MISYSLIRFNIVPCKIILRPVIDIAQYDLILRSLENIAYYDFVLCNMSVYTPSPNI